MRATAVRFCFTQGAPQLEQGHVALLEKLGATCSLSSVRWAMTSQSHSASLCGSSASSQPFGNVRKAQIGSARGRRTALALPN